MLPRLTLVLAGCGALLLTPAFAYSYFLAYGLPAETPPGWLARAGGALADAGLVDGSPEHYDRYGVAYLGCAVVGLAGLLSMLRAPRPGAGPTSRRAWTVVVGGLALVTLGIAGDYAVPNDVVGGIGFLLEMLGFVVTAAGTAYLGLALRRDRGVSRRTAWCVGLLGTASVVAGLALVGHIPSGPGAGLAAAAVVLGLRRGGAPSGRQGDDTQLGR